MKRVDEQQKAGLKVLVYGATGTGKTRFALTFPAIASIDTENGQTFFMKNKEFGKNLLFREVTNSVKDAEDIFAEIENELLGEVKTVVIDSETKLYEGLQHTQLNIAEARAKKAKRDSDAEGLSPKEWGKIKQVGKREQNTKIILSSKGVNIVSIAQETDIKEKSGENYVTVGYKPDMAKGNEFDYDIILRFTNKEEFIKGVKVAKFKAEVIKDRTMTFDKGTVIENPHFDMWADAYALGQSGVEGEINFRESVKKDEEVFEENDNIERIVAEIKAMGQDPDKVALITEMAKTGVIPKKFEFKSLAEAEAVLAQLKA